MSILQFNKIILLLLLFSQAKKDKHAEDDLPVCSVRPNTLPDPEPSSHMSFSVPDRSGDKESGNHDTKVRLMGNGDSDVMYSNLSNAVSTNLLTVFSNFSSNFPTEGDYM